MRRTIGLGMVAAALVLAGCESSTDSGDDDDIEPTENLTFTQLEPDVNIPTRDTSFVVTAGEDFEIELRTDPDESDDGDDDDDEDGDEFLEFELDEESLLRRPDGTLFQPGDTITIRITVPGNAYVFYFEPSGLVFNPQRPAEIKISYVDADEDYDDDGDEDEEDGEFESALSIWRQDVLNGPWQEIGAAIHEIESDEIEFDVEHFTGFALAGN